MNIHKHRHGAPRRPYTGATITSMSMDEYYSRILDHQQQTTDMVEVQIPEDIHPVFAYEEYYDTELYIAPQPIDIEQCIQVVTSGPLTAVRCSLPPHCGSIVYDQKTSSWWSGEVGVCIGMGQKPISLRTQQQKIRLPHDWSNIQQPRYQPSTVDIIATMVVLRKPDGLQYIMSPDTLRQYPIFNITSRDFLIPSTIAIQGKYCMMRTISSKCPLTSPDAKGATFWAAGNNYTEQTPDFAIAHYTCWWYELSAATFSTESQLLRCHASYTTITYWSIMVESVARIASEVCLTILHTLKYVGMLALEQLTWSISYVIDFPTLIVSMYLISKVYNDYMTILIFSLASSIIMRLVIIKISTPFS